MFIYILACLGDLLQVFVEEVQGKRQVLSVVGCDELLKVCGVTCKLSDLLGLVFNELLLEVLSDLRVMQVLAVPGSLTMDVEGAFSDLLLGVQSLSQGLQLMKLHCVVLAFYLHGATLVEVHFVTPHGNMLDDINGLLPSFIREFLEQLAEPSPVGLIIVEVGSRQEIFIRSL